MKITFLGAARTVTGSNILVETNNKKFLMDCGLFQGQQKEEMMNSDTFLFNPNEIDFVLLSHAHIEDQYMQQKLLAICVELCFQIVVIYKNQKWNG